MEENKFEITEVGGETIEDNAQKLEKDFAIEEITESEQENAEEPSKLENLKSTSIKKPFTKEYVSGGLFIAVALSTLIVGCIVDGYMLVGIICFMLGGLAAYTMLSHVYECKKIQKLLDDGRVDTVSELMVIMKKRKKYEFMRSLGGMIRDGHLVGYEIQDGEKIIKAE